MSAPEQEQDLSAIHAPAPDEWIGKAVDFLAEGSFYPLFSLLFGVGFAIQLLRARERDTRSSVPPSTAMSA